MTEFALLKSTRKGKRAIYCGYFEVLIALHQFNHTSLFLVTLSSPWKFNPKYALRIRNEDSKYRKINCFLNFSTAPLQALLKATYNDALVYDFRATPDFLLQTGSLIKHTPINSQDVFEERNSKKFESKKRASWLSLILLTKSCNTIYGGIRLN